MRILYISGYNAWTQISEGKKPSHHLFGIHQLIDHYEKREDGSLYGVLKEGEVKNKSGEIDFYLWESVRKNIIKHIYFLLTEGKKYDLIYDCLNRGSIWIGILKRLRLMNSKVITVLHHPPYIISLLLSKSDAYVFFDEEFRLLAVNEKKSLASKFYVNEWYPDSNWYMSIKKQKGFHGSFFIDNGKTERDRELMIRAAEKAQVYIDYASSENNTDGYARAYKVDLSEYTDIAGRLKSYGCIVVPVKKFKKSKIGPLGITSFLDCIALNCPVITSDNTCFSNTVKEYELGMVYQTGNEDSLVSALIKMNNDIEFYNNCCNNIKKYSCNRNIERYSNILREIINKVYDE